MDANLSLPKIEQLSTENFHRWKYKIRLVLLYQELEENID